MTNFFTILRRQNFKKIYEEIYTITFCTLCAM